MLWVLQYMTLNYNCYNYYIIYPTSTEIVWPELTISILEAVESHHAAASPRVSWGIACFHNGTVQVSLTLFFLCWANVKAVTAPGCTPKVDPLLSGLSLAMKQQDVCSVWPCCLSQWCTFSAIVFAWYSAKWCAFSTEENKLSAIPLSWETKLFCDQRQDDSSHVAFLWMDFGSLDSL